jgi:hypothetical protein
MATGCYAEVGVIGVTLNRPDLVEGVLHDGSTQFVLLSVFLVVDSIALIGPNRSQGIIDRMEGE